MMNDPSWAAARIRENDPAIFQRMMPHAQNMAANIGPRRRLSPTELHRYSAQVVRNSRIMDDPPPGYRERGLGGIAKVLLLAALLGEL